MSLSKYSIRKLSLWLLLVLSVIATAWMTYIAFQVNARYQDALDVIHGLEAAKSNLARATLDARMKPLANYDVLNGELRQLSVGLDKMASLVVQIDNNALSTEVARLRGDQEETASLVDSFRRDNSTIKNSLQYFPHAVHDLILAGAHEKEIPRGDLAMLSHAMLLYLGQASPENRVQLEEWFSNVKRVRPNLSPAMAHKLDLVLAHATNIRDALPRLDDTTAQLTSQKSADEFKQLHDLLTVTDREHGRAVNLVLVLFMMLAAVMTILLSQTWRRRALEMKLAATVFDASPEGIMITDAQTRILNVNPAFCKMRGYDREELIGLKTGVLKSGKNSLEFYQDLWDTLTANGQWSGEITNRRKNGEIIPEWLSINSILGKRGEVLNYVAVFTDLSQRYETEEKIRFLAYHDPLTSLPNRELLSDRANQALLHAAREKHMFALMLIDLDHFKNINDTLGHSAGDQLLIGVTKRLATAIRDVDTLSRLGGDEFVFLPGEIKSLEDAEALALKILAILAEPFEIDGHTLRVTASIGIAVYPDNGSDYETLLREADSAMYNAKRIGRDNVSFPSGKTDERMTEYLNLHAELANAIKNNEIQVHYQPQINLQNDEIKGVEALARWTHPQLGSISPARFIPVAEATGLIAPIGTYILREACHQARAWDRWGLTVAVNVSAVQFRRADELLHEIHGALQDSGLEPSRLEIELTESLLMENIEQVEATLVQLKKLGVRISIDDFGTGYSSLTYLKGLEIDVLKIDQSFVRDLEADHDDASIVVAIIQLAKALGMDTVAEGIETHGQLQFLMENGCSVGQGYKFLRPQTAAEVTTFLENWAGIGNT